MAQHITSVTDLYERTQVMGYEPDGTEKIYVVHGTGSDRDRVFELSQLGTYILNSADGFDFTAVNERMNAINVYVTFPYAVFSAPSDSDKPTFAVQILDSYLKIR